MRFIVRNFALAAVTALAVSSLVSVGASANPVDCEVNTYTDVAGDSTTRTLRYCLGQVPAGGTVSFNNKDGSSDADRKTIELTDGLTLTATGDVTIDAGSEINGENRIAITRAEPVSTVNSAATNPWPLLLAAMGTFKLTLEGIKFFDGDARNFSNGGAVRLLNGTLHVIDSSFNDNKATNGGAIDSSGQTIIENSAFRSNEAGGDGGSIHIVDNGGSLRIVDSSFSMSNAPNGGAVYTESLATLDLDGVQLIDNLSSGYGGVLWAWSDLVTITDSTFVGNTGAADGGAMLVYSEDFSLTNSFLAENTSTNNGGAVNFYAYPANGPAKISNSTFVRNSGVNGGAIADDRSTGLYLTNNTFVDNEASGAGETVSSASLDMHLFGNLFISTGSVPGSSQSHINGGTVVNEFGNLSTAAEPLLDPEKNATSVAVSDLGIDAAATSAGFTGPTVSFSSLGTGGAVITAEDVSNFETSASISVQGNDQLGTIRVAPYLPGALFIPLSQSSPAPSFSAPAPYQGPVISRVGSSTGVVTSSTGEKVSIAGSNLDAVTSVTVGGVDAEILSEGNELSFIVPTDLDSGTYDLVITSPSGSVRLAGAITISASSVAGYGELKAWTKRISATEAKVYVKYPEVGNQLQISMQSGGDGNYESVVTRTVQSRTDDFLTVNENGTYFVRTISLSDINRIRVVVDGEKLVQVVYR